jgi:hypothetical protein
MTEIRTRVLVGPDHRISGTAPAGVPPGEHEVAIIVTLPPTYQRPPRTVRCRRSANSRPRTLARGAEPAPRGSVRRRRTVSFVDTNVLVYATASSAPFRDRARAALVRLAANEPLSVSRQILREYVAVMTRPQTWGRALSLAEAMMDAAVFERRFTFLRTARRCGTS